MKLLLLVGGLTMASLSHALLFDNFTGGAYDSGQLTAVGTTNAWQTTPTVAGGVRFVSQQITANPFSQNSQVRIVPSFGMTFANQDSGVDGRLSLGYGYANNSTVAGSNALNINSTGNPLYVVTFMQNDLPSTATITLFSSTLGSVSRTVNIAGGVTSVTPYTFDFTGASQLARVDAVTLTVNPLPSGDFAIRRIESVPEPASMAAIGIGLVGLARARRRKRA